MTTPSFPRSPTNTEGGMNARSAYVAMTRGSKARWLLADCNPDAPQYVNQTRSFINFAAAATARRSNADVEQSAQRLELDIAPALAERPRHGLGCAGGAPLASG